MFMYDMPKTKRGGVSLKELFARFKTTKIMGPISLTGEI